MASATLTLDGYHVLELMQCSVHCRWQGWVWRLCWSAMACLRPCLQRACGCMSSRLEGHEDPCFAVDLCNSLLCENSVSNLRMIHILLPAPAALLCL